MNIAVVGGAGFIGSHLIDKLLDHGHEVTVFDIMMPHRGDVRHVYIDITNISSTSVALTGYYDAVYLLAAMADVNDIFRNPTEAALVNILGVANVLEAARRNDLNRVILASTVWLYEMSPEKIAMETTPLDLSRVQHVYTATKAAAELYCHAYQKLYEQDFTILRYGIPYGPRGRGGTVIANFVRAALEGKPLTIHGDGMQYRNFVYVEDLAEGNVAALNDAATNQTYNLEGIRPITIRQVAETIQAALPGSIIEYQEGRPGNFAGHSVSAEKAKKELGWEPRIDLTEGVRRYI
ncbi:MAG: NAD-dependent epimerase/dehydratase family protein, partial [Halobacteriota archaeon]